MKTKWNLIGIVFFLILLLNAVEPQCNQCSSESMNRPQIVDIHLTSHDALYVGWTAVDRAINYVFRYAVFKKDSVDYCSLQMVKNVTAQSECLEISLESFPGTNETTYFFRVIALLDEGIETASDCVIHTPLHDISRTADGLCEQAVQIVCDGGGLPQVMMSNQRCIQFITCSEVVDISNCTSSIGSKFCNELCFSEASNSANSSLDVLAVCISNEKYSCLNDEFCGETSKRTKRDAFWHLHFKVAYDSQCPVDSQKPHCSKMSCQTETVLTASPTKSSLPSNGTGHHNENDVPNKGIVGIVFVSFYGGVFLSVILVLIIYLWKNKWFMNKLSHTINFSLKNK